MRNAMLVLLVLFLCLPAGAARFDIAVEPGRVAWDENAWVGITITNVLDSETVELALFADINANGSVETSDVGVASFRLTNGTTNWLGAASFPADEDGLPANAAIQTRVSYFGIDGPMHIIGSYLWRVTGTNGDSAVAPFSITQPTSTVYITGSVKVYMTVNPVPGAIVGLEPFFDETHYSPACWADSNGDFRIDLPADASRAGVRGVYAVAPGYLTVPFDDGAGTWVSFYPFNGPLSAGENALTNSLYVVPAIPGEVATASGHVYDADTNGISCAFVQFESDDEDSDVSSFAFTGTNGFFAMPVPEGMTGMVFSADPMLTMRGYVGAGSPVEIDGDQSVDLFCPDAEILALASVRDAQSGAPVPGVNVFIGGDENGGGNFTLSDGVAEIGLIEGTNYSAEAEDGLGPQHYMGVEEIKGLAITNAGVFTNIPFEAERGGIVSGTVYDRATNALTGGECGAFHYPTYNGWWEYNTDVDFGGNYELLVFTGTYAVGAANFNGYLQQNYSNHFTWEWDNGVVADPEDVTTAGVSGIDFYLPAASFIRGNVQGGGGPLSDASVSAHIGWDWRGGTMTDTNGDYELPVLGGTSYVVQVDPPEGSFFMYQYYSNVYSSDDATPVFTDTNAPAEGIDFDLLQGGRVEGAVYEPDGITPMTNAWGMVAGLDEDRNWVNSDDIDTNGHYSVVLTAGVYRMRAEADGWLTQYYNGFYEFQFDAANVITVAVTQVVSGIDFTLQQPSYIEGHVSSGGSPIEGMEISVDMVADTNTWQREYLGRATSDSNGNYSAEVPPSSNVMVAVQPDGSSYYVREIWSNVFSEQEATLVAVAPGATLSGIDFDLLQGGRVEGAVYEPDGTTPLTNVWGMVAGLDEDQNLVNGGNLDDAGHYSVILTAGVYRMRAEADGYLDQYYDGFYGYQFDAANVITVVLEQVVSGIDFVMKVPSYIEGHVSSGGSAVEGMRISVEYVADTNTWQRQGVGNANSDSNGNYSVAVPPFTNLLVMAEPDSSSYYVGEIWSNAFSEQEATLVAVATGATLSSIDFDLELGMRIVGRVVDENEDPLQNLAMAALVELNSNHEARGWAYTDWNGDYAFILAATTSYVIQAQRPWYVPEEDWWYPKMYFSNTVGVYLGEKLSTAAGTTISNIDFRLEPGYHIVGHVYLSDGSTPAASSFVRAYSASRLFLFSEPANGGAYYLVTVPTNEPFYLQGNAAACVSEYYDNEYAFSNSVLIQSSIMTTVRVDFALYGIAEDTDFDGLPNYQEDSHPDGVYVPAEDWSSYTTNDTEGDLVDDQAEWNMGTSPKMADTDGDTFTDHQEIYVTGTDPQATASGSNSYLRCAQTTRSGTNVIVTWDSIPYVNGYRIERSTELKDLMSWTEIAGPIMATSTVMSIVDTNAPPGAAYRVRIPY